MLDHGVFSRTTIQQATNQKRERQLRGRQAFNSAAFPGGAVSRHPERSRSVQRSTSYQLPKCSRVTFGLPAGYALSKALGTSWQTRGKQVSCKNIGVLKAAETALKAAYCLHDKYPVPLQCPYSALTVPLQFPSGNYHSALIFYVIQKGLPTPPSFKQ